MNRNIDAVSEYTIEEDGGDFVNDDVALPIGYQEEEGDYFGLPGVPYIDEMINAEDAMTSISVPRLYCRIALTKA